MIEMKNRRLEGLRLLKDENDFVRTSEDARDAIYSCTNFRTRDFSERLR